MHKTLPSAAFLAINQSWFLLFSEFLIGAVTFYAVLLLPILPALGRFLKYGTLLPAIVLVLVFWFLLSRMNIWSRWLGVVAHFLLFSIPLAWLWQSDTADWGVIGGIIPVSDAAIYTMDAARLIQGVVFSATSTYRPMANGFIAVLLKITGGDYQLAVSILVFLAALAIYALVSEVKQSRGALAASVTLVIMFLFYRVYIGKTLTESLGITFAAFAFAIMIKGARGHNPVRVVAGLGLFTVAMNIRAGAYLAIIALLVWAWTIFRENKLRAIGVLVSGLSVVIIAFGLNTVVLRSIGTPDAVPFANFSDSFYGLASGYKGWRYVGQVYPGATPLQEYQYAFQLIKEEPQLLAKGIALAYVDFFNPSSYNIFSFMNFHAVEGGDLYKGRPGTENSLAYYPLFILAALGIVQCLRSRNWWNQMLVAGWAGMLASVPFVPPMDAGIRPYAVTVPLVGFMLGEGIIWLAQKMSGDAKAEPKSIVSKDWPILVSLILLAFVVGGPLLVKRFATPFTSPAALQCAVGEEYLLLKLVANARIDIVDEDAPGLHSSRRPEMPISLYQDNILRLKLPPELVEQLAGLSVGQTLQYAVDLGLLSQNLRPILVVIPTQVVSYSDQSVFQACAVRFGNTSMGQFFKTSEVRPLEDQMLSP